MHEAYKKIQQYKNGKMLSCILLLILCASVVSFFEVKQVSAALPDVTDEINDALQYLNNSQNVDGSICDYNISCWAVMAIAAAGEDPHNWIAPGGNVSIVDYLKDNLQSNINSSDADYPLTLSRIILALTAAGENVSDIDGFDLVTALKNTNSSGQFGSTGKLNDDFWAVLALISAGEPVNSSLIQNSASYIMSHQNEDGGWSWNIVFASDVDDTAAAVMALAAAGEGDSSNVTSALVYLDSIQLANGGFDSWSNNVTNAASASWVIGALVSCGIHPAQFPYDGSVLDNLLTYQNVDGSFNWTSSNDNYAEWITSYAIVALTYNAYPVNVETTIYLAGDYDHDNDIDYSDLSTFLDYYNSQNILADLTGGAITNLGDGAVNYKDYNIFIAYYNEF